MTARGLPARIAVMSRATGMDDMFGHVPQNGDLDLPADKPALRVPVKHTADTIRVIALRVLAEARAARTMPWDARDLRFNTGMFPYWAEWLKNGEGDGLMAEFKAEMDRLNAPKDIVAPNWKAIWGIAD